MCFQLYETRVLKSHPTQGHSTHARVHTHTHTHSLFRRHVTSNINFPDVQLSGVCEVASARDWTRP